MSVDLRENSRGYVVRGYEFGKMIADCFDVPDGENPIDHFRRSHPNAQPDIFYPINLPEIILALKTRDVLARQDSNPRGVSQVFGLEGTIDFSKLVLDE